MPHTVSHNGPTVPLAPRYRRPVDGTYGASAPTVPVRRPVQAPIQPSRNPTRRGPVPLPQRPTRNARGWYWTILIGFALLLHLLLYNSSGGYSWHFFTEGAGLLTGQHPPGTTLPGGMHVYANYPQLQIGPVALLLAAAVAPFGATGGWLIAALSMTLAGLVVLYLVEHVARTVRPDVDATSSAVTMLVGGGSFVVSWELLAVYYGHLDDVLALLLLACALVAVAHRSPILAGLCIGLAADAKPWALACAALLLVFPLRQSWRAGMVAAAVIGLAWLPFVLADPHTLGVAAFTIPNVPASGLHALGVTTPATPSWDRAAQLGIGCLLGAVAVARRRWEAVIALGLGVRIALDPSVYAYYTAGLALGLLVWDLVGYRRPMPALSLLCFAGLTVAGFVLKTDSVLGDLRLWSVLLACAVMLAVPRRPRDKVATGHIAAGA
jgi:hypothetical protein